MLYKDFIASLIAGITSELSVIPICTIQTVYQTQPNLNNVKRESIMRVTLNLYKKYGITAFFNASYAAILSQMVSTASKFTIYEYIKSQRNTSTNDLFNNMLNGALSGILSLIFTQPFDVIKNYHQRQLSIRSDLKGVSNPLKILYRGTTQSMSKSVLLIATLYPINDYVKQYTGNSVMLSAFCTTIIVSPIIHPIDLLKRRAMANQSIWMGINPVHYYRGLFINWCRAMPHFVVTMTTIDYVKRFI